MRYDDPYAPPLGAERRGREAAIVREIGSKCPKCGNKYRRDG